MTSNNDSVSVVVPFFNRAAFLKRLLDSIAKQTLPVNRIYIVDNGSSLDEVLNAWQIIKSHPLRKKCIFTSTLRKGNANYARNLGYELANTKYVAFLDSDDWWNPNHLYQSISSLKDSDKVAVYSGAIIHRLGGTSVNKSADIELFNNPFHITHSSKGYTAQTSSYVVNKNILKYKVVWDERLKRHQDFDFFSAIFYKSLGWCYCPHANTNIDWDDGGTSIKDVHYESMILYYNKWKKKIPTEIKKRYLLYMLIYTTKNKAPMEIITFYSKEIKEYKYFKSNIYKLKSSNFSIYSIITLLNIIRKLRLEEGTRNILNRLL